MSLFSPVSVIASVRGSRGVVLARDFLGGIGLGVDLWAVFLGAGLEIFLGEGFGCLLTGLEMLFLCLGAGAVFLGVGLDGAFCPKWPMSFLAKFPRGAEVKGGIFMESPL